MERCNDPIAQGFAVDNEGHTILSPRDPIAMAALTGLCARDRILEGDEWYAVQRAYRLADMALQVRKQYD